MPEHSSPSQGRPNRWRRFADWDERPLRLDNFAREDPENGFAAFRSPHDPSPGFEIAEGRIAIVPTGLRDNQCPPERLLMDKELLDHLAQVTGWRWEGQLLVLVGPKPLRYRPTSN